MLLNEWLKKQRERAKYVGLLEVLIQVCCSNCEGANLKKNGQKANRNQNYRCPNCSKQFQDRHAYCGADPRIKQQVVSVTLDASRIRDISQILKLYPNSVVDSLRRHAKKI